MHHIQGRNIFCLLRHWWLYCSAAPDLLGNKHQPPPTVSSAGSGETFGAADRPAGGKPSGQSVSVAFLCRLPPPSLQPAEDQRPGGETDLYWRFNTDFWHVYWHVCVNPQVTMNDVIAAERVFGTLGHIAATETPRCRLLLLLEESRWEHNTTPIPTPTPTPTQHNTNTNTNRRLMAGACAVLWTLIIGIKYVKNAEIFDSA